MQLPSPRCWRQTIRWPRIGWPVASCMSALRSPLTASEATYVLGGEYTRLVRPDGEIVELRGRRTWSAVLSDVCDVAYADGPTVRNEMLARRELSSQAAQGEAICSRPWSSTSGSFTRPSTRLRSGTGDARFSARLLGYLQATRDGLAVLRALRRFRLPAGVAADRSFVRGRPWTSGRLDEVWRILQAPPIGLPEGPIPVLVTAALLVHAADIAVYQDGTFQPIFSTELIERLLLSPVRFAVKHFATSGPRGKVLAALADCLPLPQQGDGTPPSSASCHLSCAPCEGLRNTRDAPQVLTTKPKPCRDALAHAVEPDELLFAALPAAVGMNTFPRTAGSPKPEPRSSQRG